MKVFIAGGAGFIGAQITAQLLKQHEVIIGAREVNKVKRRFPDAEVCACNFAVDTDEQTWLNRLEGVDAVVNCVGVLHKLSQTEINAIHYETPKALFEACHQLGIKRIVHISAMGIEGSDVAYASTKRKLDEVLLHQENPITIFRPSFVYSNTSYGGSSLFRALAAFPGFIPLVGDGTTRFQPIHARDLAAMVAAVLENTPPTKPELLYAAGPEILDFKNLLQKLRAWLGLKAAPFVCFPFGLLKIAAPLGNILPWLPVNSTTVAMMQEADFDIDPQKLKKTVQRTGVHPQSFSQNLQCNPSGTQDLWQARLYFLHPLLRSILAFLWAWSGIVGLVMHGQSYSLFQKAGVPANMWGIFLVGSCIFDIGLGLAVLSGQQRKIVDWLQLLTVLFYTIFISFTLPALWLDPFAPVAKNLPILLAILFLMVLGKER